MDRKGKATIRFRDFSEVDAGVEDKNSGFPATSPAGWVGPAALL
jgi:hypothetical protein